MTLGTFASKRVVKIYKLRIDRNDVVIGDKKNILWLWLDMIYIQFVMCFHPHKNHIQPQTISSVS